MATKKTTEEIVEEKEFDPEELVELRVPRGNEKDDPNEFISVNGRNFLIPKGKKVMVPAFIKWEYERAQRAKDQYYEKIDDLMEQAKLQIPG